MLYIHAHCVGPVRRVRLKGADTTCEAFTLIIPTKEALVSAEEMQAERAPFPWRRLLRNLSRADSATSPLFLSMEIDDVPYANSRKANFVGFSFQACAF